jgi:hypothetical protein
MKSSGLVQHERIGLGVDDADDDAPAPTERRDEAAVPVGRLERREVDDRGIERKQHGPQIAAQRAARGPELPSGGARAPNHGPQRAGHQVATGRKAPQVHRRRVDPKPLHVDRKRIEVDDERRIPTLADDVRVPAVLNEVDEPRRDRVGGERVGSAENDDGALRPVAHELASSR